MPEEMRFFLRTGLYTALIGTVYWFVSYEVTGTVMLAFLLAACAFFVIAALFLHGDARKPGVRGRDARGRGVRDPGGDPKGASEGAPQLGALVRRAVGFDAPGEDPGAPLEFEESLFPTASLWPLGAAVAATLVGLGAIYGPWLWIPGLSLGLATGTAWLTQLRS
jgi:hypothetical protein